MLRTYFMKLNLSKSKYTNGNLVIEFEVSNERNLFQQIIVWLPNFKIIKPDVYKKHIAKKLNQGLLNK